MTDHHLRWVREDPNSSKQSKIVQFLALLDTWQARLAIRLICLIFSVKHGVVAVGKFGLTSAAEASGVCTNIGAVAAVQSGSAHALLGLSWILIWVFLELLSAVVHTMHDAHGCMEAGRGPLARVRIAVRRLVRAVIRARAKEVSRVWKV